MKWLMRILGKGKKKKAGFTLIELMVVVIVVGILAAAAIPIYRFALSRAYSSEAKATMGTMLTSMKVFAAETPTGAYPDEVWGGANDGDQTLDIMTQLGVDTSTNTWWHCGFEKGAAAAEVTCRMGTVDKSINALPGFAKIDPTDATGTHFVWAIGTVLPVKDIELLYDMDEDEWFIGY